MNLARILQASSTDIGTTFAAPAPFGDGSANQSLPRLLNDGARLWFGWLDARAVTPALFQNRMP
jgi:hypothetical protein